MGETLRRLPHVYLVCVLRVVGNGAAGGSGGGAGGNAKNVPKLSPAASFTGFFTRQLWRIVKEEEMVQRGLICLRSVTVVFHQVRGDWPRCQMRCWKIQGTPCSYRQCD